jgi:ATP-dependent Clp protease ATP-binding subunit ClpC
VVQLFERFTDTARRVVVSAQEEARLLNHDNIGTEHILLGLLHDDTEAAAQILGAAGVELERARAQVEGVVGRGDEAPGSHIPFTPSAKKVLELSLREALQLGHNYIGSEHILLGLLRETDGRGAQILEGLGAELGDVRQDILTDLRSRQQPPQPHMPQRPGRIFSGTGGGGLSEVEARLSAIEERLERIERLLKEGSGRDSA